LAPERSVSSVLHRQQVQSDSTCLLTVLVACCSGAFIAGWVLERVQEWNQLDTLAVILSALGAILTALGIGIALLALWGYTSIRDEVVKRAETVAAGVAEAVARDKAETVAARTVRDEA
jgi:biotin transporter BioY